MLILATILNFDSVDESEGAGGSGEVGTCENDGGGGDADDEGVGESGSVANSRPLFDVFFWNSKVAVKRCNGCSLNL